MGRAIQLGELASRATPLRTALARGAMRTVRRIPGSVCVGFEAYGRTPSLRVLAVVERSVFSPKRCSV